MDNSKLQNKYSFSKLNRIIYEIERAKQINEYNQMFIVEQIRNLSEFLVYAEKFQKNYFELFIEINIMEHFTRLLFQDNRLINIQLIQTMSILIQNITEKMKLFYIFAHPFMNELISYNFDFNQDDEMVDYYVSFLKSLTLKLNEETVNFFFNDKFKTFPLYHQAIKFYNHKESMVRTSVRTITLTIYNIQNAKMRELFLGLPYCAYFANLACYLRDFWIQIDKHVVSLTSDPKQIDLMMSDAEDANETLFYMQDIFQSGDPEINKMLTNALLHYSYLPTIVQSLCSLKCKPSLSINTCLYVLTQTFRIIKQKEFTNLLLTTLFHSHTSASLLSNMEAIPKNPSTYSPKYQCSHLSTYSISQYVQEFYNMNNLDVFLLHGSTNFEFLKEIKQEYQELIQANNMGNGSVNENNMELNEAEIRKRIQEMFFKKLNASDVEVIREEHVRLSNGLGLKVGLLIQNYEQGKIIYTENNLIQEYDSILTSISQGRLKEMKKNQNKDIIFSFLRSKDDNLLLLVGGLIMSIQYNKEVNPLFIGQCSEICPISLKRKIMTSNQQENEQQYNQQQQMMKQQSLNQQQAKSPNIQKEEVKQSFSEAQEQMSNLSVTSSIDLTESSLIPLILDKLETDPPFRNFTLRLYSKMLLDLAPPFEVSLKKEMLQKLAIAYKFSINQVKRLVYQLDNNAIQDPFFNFYENVIDEVEKFQPIESIQEFNRHLAQPMLMLPFICDELQSKIPEVLRLPKIEEDQTNFKNYLNNFLLLRSLVYLYSPKFNPYLGKQFSLSIQQQELQLSSIAPSYSGMKIDYGIAGEWSANQTIVPIPSNKRYQNCFMKNDKGNQQQMFMMADDNFFVLLKPNFSNPSSIRAVVQLICKHKIIVDNIIEKNEPKNLFLAMIQNHNPEAFTELVLYFDEKKRCEETKQFLDFKRKSQLDIEKQKISNFLQEICDKEQQEMLNEE